MSVRCKFCKGFLKPEDIKRDETTYLLGKGKKIYEIDVVELTKVCSKCKKQEFLEAQIMRYERVE